MTSRLIRYPLPIVTLFMVVSLVWAIMVYGQSVEAAQAITRFTARISLFVFAWVFTASALHKLLGSDFTAELLRNRRQWGIAFAYSHTIHLFAILLFFRLSGNPPPVLSLIFGGMGYVLLYALAFTSNDGAVKRLGAKNWKRLHKTGVYYLWFIFFLTYLKRLMPDRVEAPRPGGTKMEFVIGFVILLAILVIRITATVVAKTDKKSKTLTESEVIS
jgi:DMSO/TMAO reductase YedYZ heme-binding membrane subunit